MEDLEVMPALRFAEFKDEWKSHRFQNLLMTSRLGGNYPNTLVKTNYPLIKMGNLGRGFIKLDRIEYIPETEKVNSLDKIEFGDLFFNTRNTLDLVGKVAIWKNELPTAYYNSNLMYVKFENNFFMNYRLNSYQGIKALKALATGTTSVAAIYSKDLNKVKLFVPSLPEQQKIATFLTAVDDKIQQLTKKKFLLEKYKMGVMHQIFNQEIRFKDDAGTDYPRWMEKKLGDICDIQSGDSPSKYNLEQMGLYPFLKVEELNNCYKYQVESREYTNDTKSLIPMNSIVFPKRGAAILNNKIRICVTDVYMDSNLMALIAIPSMVNYEFLFYVINFIKLYKIADTSSIPQINNKHIIPYKVKIPGLEEQTKIANFLSAIDDKINHVHKQLTQTQAYKKGLLQQMFV